MCNFWGSLTSEKKTEKKVSLRFKGGKKVVTMQTPSTQRRNSP